MIKKPGKPKKTVVDGDEYFYRDNEMMRTEINEDEQLVQVPPIDVKNLGNNH